MTDTDAAPDPDVPAPDAPEDGPGRLTHVREDGSAHMVDVGAKPVTRRVARAQAELHTRPEVIAQLVQGTLPKGEALGTARVAGIMAAKRTWELIPLCHPLALGRVSVDFEAEEPDGTVRVIAEVATTGVTGVEMEALTAASVAALTLYDMIKAVDKHAEISGTRVLAKSGGMSGDWSAS
jgi:cyclic pyranopterin phosphate synthase